MKKIADSTVRRLSLYLRFLEEFEEQGIDTVSSEALAARGQTTSAQVRKDLSFFGSFGKRGLGYEVPELAATLRDILGLKRSYKVIVIGAGNIGAALAQYPGFGQRGFNIVSVYDSDSTKIGLLWNGHKIKDVEQLDADLHETPIDIAILTTPARVAQQVANRLVDAGIRAILNFAPMQLNVPDDIAVKNVNMALELEALSYALRNR